jgi:hypothetical protein
MTLIVLLLWKTLITREYYVVLLLSDSVRSFEYTRCLTSFACASYCTNRCPWTGTAIGRKNMPAFQAFVGLVFFCLIIDILLLTGALG